jgi:hypothetical protein
VITVPRETSSAGIAASCTLSTFGRQLDAESRHLSRDAVVQTSCVRQVRVTHDLGAPHSIEADSPSRRNEDVRSPAHRPTPNDVHAWECRRTSTADATFAQWGRVVSRPQRSACDWTSLLDRRRCGPATEGGRSGRLENRRPRAADAVILHRRAQRWPRRWSRQTVHRLRRRRSPLPDKPGILHGSRFSEFSAAPADPSPKPTLVRGVSDTSASACFRGRRPVNRAWRRTRPQRPEANSPFVVVPLGDCLLKR